MIIEVLGPGCPKCKVVKRLIQEVIEDMEEDVGLVEVHDIGEMIARGVMITPAVFVDGELKCMGRIPQRKEVKAWLSSRKGKRSSQPWGG